MKWIYLSLTTVLVAATLSSCASLKVEEQNHRARASSCLVTSAVSQVGSPDKQLGFDLVEAKVFYGLNAKEITVPKGFTEVEVQNLLLNSLEGGCVYFLTSASSLRDSVSRFAAKHRYVVALLIGGNKPVVQPANVRWIADDIQSGAALAGFVAAAKSTNGKVYLVFQSNYFEKIQVIRSFKSGLKSFNDASGVDVSLDLIKVGNASQAQKALENLSDQDLIAVFAGTKIWHRIKQSKPMLIIGSDLQLGNGRSDDPRVIASVERNFNSVVLGVAKDLLDKKFKLNPVFAVEDAFGSGYIELRPRDNTIFDPNLTALLDSYRTQLSNAKTD